MKWLWVLVGACAVLSIGNLVYEYSQEEDPWKACYGFASEWLKKESAGKYFVEINEVVAWEIMVDCLERKTLEARDPRIYGSTSEPKGWMLFPHDFGEGKDDDHRY